MKDRKAIEVSRGELAAAHEELKALRVENRGLLASLNERREAFS